jgi:dipeptidyl aminopeptidase/acylaminoacyl peptidase
MTGIYLIDMATAGLRKLTSTGNSPTWSPDGDKIAFYDKDAINLINPDGSEWKELTDAVPDQPAQAWSPDGERIAFVKQSDLYMINADGSGLPSRSVPTRFLPQRHGVRESRYDVAPAPSAKGLAGPLPYFYAYTAEYMEKLSDNSRKAPLWTPEGGRMEPEAQFCRLS